MGGVVKSPTSAVAGLVEILTQMQETEERINLKAERLEALYEAIMENSSEDLDTFKEVEDALFRLRQQLEDYKKAQGKPVFKIERVTIENDTITLNDDIPVSAITNRGCCIIEMYNNEIKVPLQKIEDSNDFTLGVINPNMFDGMTAIVEYML